MGGKGNSSTTTNTYRPLTSDELRMQKLSTDYAESIMPSAFQLYNTGMSGLNQTINPRPDYNTLYSNQAAATAANTATANGLAQGQVPQAYLDNERTVINNQLQGTIGSAINDLNKRGVINSSVGSSALTNIGNSVAATIANNFNNNLSTASGLLTNSQNLANMPISQAAQAEQASYATPLSIFQAATGQAQPATNIWQPTLLSNQSNPTSTTTTQSGGGNLFGGLLTGFASGAGGAYGKSLWG